MKREQQHAGDDGLTDESARHEALTVSELRYRRLFESAKDGILILDAETGMVVDANPFLTELLGFSREEFLGKRVWELADEALNIATGRTANIHLAMDSFGSDVSRFFTGSPTDRAVWLLIGGTVATVAGLSGVTLFRAGRQ